MRAADQAQPPRRARWSGSDRHAAVAAHGARVSPFDARGVDVPFGEPPNCLFEADAPFEPRERGADAEVHAVAEGQVVGHRAPYVEAIGVPESALVATGAAGEQQ